MQADHVLLEKQIGTLGYVGDPDTEHRLPNINLYERKNAQVLAQSNPFEISEGLFSEETKSMSFSLDPEAVENVFLSFQAPIRQGVLTVSLNGQDLYQAEVESQTPPAIPILSSLLQRDNMLVFSVSNGLFSTKRYSLHDVKVIGDVIDATSQEASSTFVLDAEEFSNLDRGRISFFLECFQQDIGTLEVMLNRRSVFSGTPVCDSMNTIDVFKNDFSPDRNELFFRLNRGGALLDTIRVNTELVDTKPFIDYFSITDDLFSDIEDDAREVILTMRFVDDGRSKEAELAINGVAFSIDQKEEVYERDISEVVRRGNNDIRLTPLSELHIVELLITYD
ncbi:hypothetical protein GF342_04140 [Candidatus Woesearchaeota archaeon]|nr:hypothetical protein [Candidatus Woesearchaeota archaeon]